MRPTAPPRLPNVAMSGRQHGGRREREQGGSGQHRERSAQEHVVSAVLNRWNITVWVPAQNAAARLSADYPGWDIQVVRRRNGVGIAARREGDGTCVVVGSEAEVRDALAAAAAGAPEPGVSMTTDAPDD